MSHFKIIESSTNGTYLFRVHHVPSKQDWIEYKTIKKAHIFIKDLEDSNYDFSGPINLNEVNNRLFALITQAKMKADYQSSKISFVSIS